MRKHIAVLIVVLLFQGCGDSRREERSTAEETDLLQADPTATDGNRVPAEGDGTAGESVRLQTEQGTAQVELRPAPREPGRTVSGRRRARDDIRFTVAKFIFNNNASSWGGSATYFFLEISGHDPSPEFLARFKSFPRSVLPVSQAKVPEKGKETLEAVQSGGPAVTHKQLSGVGIIFRINRIKWINHSKVEVKWGYYEAPLSGSGNTATVEFKDNAWTVTSDHMNVIS